MMKINKWITYMGLIIGILGVILIVFFEKIAVISNIGISLFASAIVASTTSILYYILLNKLDEIAKEFYHSKKDSWEKCKIQMQSSVENVIAEAQSY